ncbi:hypothetical protein Lsan_4034 [Legionella santicrucis]|uniref:Uncharacterized protein n=1 Tax=Legionella santicrucis TaxID=45074 RepID=A0A0W0Y9N1_9GAMM|nr:EamA family transporter [Legionella santicrucis]KTD53624.1 hypothetical protein Lsan_4034 [Legionella santicrucis]
MKKINLSSAMITALSAAILFGGSTPFAKQLIGNTSPILLAGLLYLGSGIGLFLLRFIKDRTYEKRLN